jgi:hypothetical protein
MYDYFILRINAIDHGDRQTNTEREKKKRGKRDKYSFSSFFLKEYKMQRTAKKILHIDSVNR